MLARPPHDWAERTLRLRGKYEAWGSRLRHLKRPDNRRGDFRAHATGYSYGQGQKVPTNMASPSKAVQKVMDEMLADPDVQGVMKYASGEPAASM